MATTRSISRLTVEYEDIYLNDYGTVPALQIGLENYFQLYNYERPHQSLAYRTPAEIHFSASTVNDL